MGAGLGVRVTDGPSAPGRPAPRLMLGLLDWTKRPPLASEEVARF